MTRDEAIKAMRDNEREVRHISESYHYRIEHGRIYYRNMVSGASKEWVLHNAYDYLLWDPKYDSGWELVKRKVKRQMYGVWFDERYGVSSYYSQDREGAEIYAREYPESQVISFEIEVEE